LSASPANLTRKDDEPKNKANDAKKIQNRDAKKDSKEVRNEKESKDTKSTTDWTPTQDAKLLEMKASNKSWKDIETEIGKPRHIAQPRFKELQGQGKAADVAEQGKDKQKNTSHEQKKAEYRKEWEAEAKAKEDQKKDNNSKKGKQHNKDTNKGKANQEKKDQAGNSGKQDQAKAATEKKYTLAHLSKIEDRNFPIRELGIIADLVAGLDAKEKATWEVVASRYFDRSGCRVDGEDLKETFEALERA